MWGHVYWGIRVSERGIRVSEFVLSLFIYYVFIYLFLLLFFSTGLVMKKEPEQWETNSQTWVSRTQRKRTADRRSKGWREDVIGRGREGIDWSVLGARASCGEGWLEARLPVRTEARGWRGKREEGRTGARSAGDHRWVGEERRGVGEERGENEVKWTGQRQSRKKKHRRIF